MNREQMARQFAIAGEQKIDNDLTDTDLLDFRFSLIYEEVLELSDAIDQVILDKIHGDVKQSTKENLLKELADIQYVLSGFAVVFGFNLEEAYRRVHESNMTKFPLTKREDGKVMKGENYKEPVLEDLV